MGRKFRKEFLAAISTNETLKGQSIRGKGGKVLKQRGTERKDKMLHIAIKTDNKTHKTKQISMKQREIVGDSEFKKKKV